MKKLIFAAMLALVLAISVGFTACDGMATLKLTNDTSTTQNFVLYINDEVGDNIILLPSTTHTEGRTGDFTYTVSRSRNSSTYIWKGTVVAGETKELKFSNAGQ